MLSHCLAECCAVFAPRSSLLVWMAQWAVWVDFKRVGWRHQAEGQLRKTEVHRRGGCSKCRPCSVASQRPCCSVECSVLQQAARHACAEPWFGAVGTWKTEHLQLNKHGIGSVQIMRTQARSGPQRHQDWQNGRRAGRRAVYAPGSRRRYRLPHYELQTGKHDARWSKQASRRDP